MPQAPLDPLQTCLEFGDFAQMAANWVKLKAEGPFPRAWALAIWVSGSPREPSMRWVAEHVPTHLDQPWSSGPEPLPHCTTPVTTRGRSRQGGFRGPVARGSFSEVWGCSEHACSELCKQDSALNESRSGLVRSSPMCVTLLCTNESFHRRGVPGSENAKEVSWRSSSPLREGPSVVRQHSTRPREWVTQKWSSFCSPQAPGPGPLQTCLEFGDCAQRAVNWVKLKAEGPFPWYFASEDCRKTWAWLGTGNLGQ